MRVDKGFSTIEIALTIVVIASLAGGVLIWYVDSKLSKTPAVIPLPTSQPSIVPLLTLSVTPTPDPYDRWETYQSTHNHYSFKYPPVLTLLSKPHPTDRELGIEARFEYLEKQPVYKDMSIITKLTMITPHDDLYTAVENYHKNTSFPDVTIISNNSGLYEYIEVSGVSLSGSFKERNIQLNQNTMLTVVCIYHSPQPEAEKELINIVDKVLQSIKV